MNPPEWVLAACRRWLQIDRRPKKDFSGRVNASRLFRREGYYSSSRRNPMCVSDAKVATICTNDATEPNGGLTTHSSHTFVIDFTILRYTALFWERKVIEFRKSKAVSPCSFWSAGDDTAEKGCCCPCFTNFQSDKTLEGVLIHSRARWRSLGIILLKTEFGVNPPKQPSPASSCSS